jgi:hypothetical protein
MPQDQLVRKRFSELEEKAEAVSKAKEFAFQSSDDRKKYYKIPPPVFKAWGTNVLNLLERVFGENSVHYKQFFDHYNRFREYESEFENCRAIFLAAKEDYEGGYLFNIRALIKAEVLDEALEQAVEILNTGYKDPACVLAGVALETSLKELCTRSTIPHGKLDKMNVELCKAGTYNIAKQKQITAWADLRNKAAHGDWSAYNEADVRDFLEGVNRFIADYL